MKVLVDTNVLVSSMFTVNTPPGLTIQAGIASAFELLISETTLDRHLLSAQGRFAFQILSPAEFVAAYLRTE